jgi:hypothetical protein
MCRSYCLSLSLSITFLDFKTHVSGGKLNFFGDEGSVHVACFKIVRFENVMVQKSKVQGSRRWARGPGSCYHVSSILSRCAKGALTINSLSLDRKLKIVGNARFFPKNKK